MYWIDNDRVLFLVASRSQKARTGEVPAGAEIFDVASRESRVYRSETRGNLCYADGNVMYTVFEGGETSGMLASSETRNTRLG